MKRHSKFLSLALKVSRMSDYRRINIGAVVAKGNTIVSMGCNSSRTHPTQWQYDMRSGRRHSRGYLHAEMQALINAKVDTEGAVLYVSREQRDGKMGMCRPCGSCMMAIREAGIRTVYYTTTEGVCKEILK